MNVGSTDRILRGIVGLVLLLSPLLNIPDIWTSMTFYYVSLLVGVVLLATAVFRFCPLYKVIGVSTDHT